MSWTTARTELRVFVRDSSTDKYRFRKKCFGYIDGTNKTFKTLERRRLTDFTTASAPEGIYIGSTRVNPADIANDYPDTGEFEFNVAPTDTGYSIEASYYIQWFLDTDLDQFLTTSAQWLGLGDNISVVPSGLRPAAIRYAACEAYKHLAIKQTESLADEYRVDDLPKEQKTTSYFMDLAKSFCDQAEKLRDDYYTRHGQTNAPLFKVSSGAVKDPQPKG